MSGLRVLVLCTGNSCRSILAEVLFNDLGKGRITCYSAGSHPAGAVNPGALRKLGDQGHAIEQRQPPLQSQSWDVFSGPDAERIDIVVTVCDSAAGETCPVWNGAPVTVHWGIPDPADASPDDEAAAFDLAYRQLRSRVEEALKLPLESMDVAERKDALQRVHERSID